MSLADEAQAAKSDIEDKERIHRDADTILDNSAASHNTDACSQ